MKKHTNEFEIYVIEKRDVHGRWLRCQESWAHSFGRDNDKDAIAYFEYMLKLEKDWNRGKKKVKRNYRLVKVRTRVVSEEILHEPVKAVRRTF